VATPEQLRALKTAQPFRPFQVVGGAGTKVGTLCTVTDPVTAGCSLDGAAMTVYSEGRIHHIDMRLVEFVEIVEPADPDGTWRDRAPLL